jgi:hypothetical protein
LADELARWLDGKPTRTRPEKRVARIARAVRRRPLFAGLALLAILAAVAVPVLLHVSDPDRPLYKIQGAIGRGETAELIPSKGGPRWSSWFSPNAGSAGVDKDGYFALEAIEQEAMLELARELPIDAYTIQARVRHRRTVHGGQVGLYVGGRSIHGPASNGHLVFVLKYDGIIDHNANMKQFLKANPLPPNVAFASSPGNPLHLEARLGVEYEPRKIAYVGLASADGVWVQPAGVNQEDQWRNLKIVVSRDSVQAFCGDDALKAFEFPACDAQLQREVNNTIAKAPDERGFLRNLPARFDPQGSLGLYILGGSASFAEFTVIPSTNARDNP